MTDSKNTETVPALKRLLLAKKAFKPIVKSSTNPFHKNKYANLEECLDAVTAALEDNGLILSFSTRMLTESMVAVSCSIIDTLSDHSNKVVISGDVVLPLKDMSPQGGAAASTYGRRYSLLSVLGLAAEDDDGNSASLLQQQAKPQQEDKKQSTATTAAVSALTEKVGFQQQTKQAPKFK